MKKKNRKNQRNYIFVHGRKFGGFVWLRVPMPVSVCVLIFDVQLQVFISRTAENSKQKAEKKTHIKNKSLAFKVDEVEEKKKRKKQQQKNKQHFSRCDQWLTVSSGATNSLASHVKCSRFQRSEESHTTNYSDRARALISAPT